MTLSQKNNKDIASKLRPMCTLRQAIYCLWFCAADDRYFLYELTFCAVVAFIRIWIKYIYIYINK